MKLNFKKITKEQVFKIIHDKSVLTAKSDGDKIARIVIGYAEIGCEELLYTNKEGKTVLECLEAKELEKITGIIFNLIDEVVEV